MVVANHSFERVLIPSMRVGIELRVLGRAEALKALVTARYGVGEWDILDSELLWCGTRD